MRDHDDCEDAINAALARGNDGLAEYLSTRCDREHGDMTAPGSAVPELRDIAARSVRNDEQEASA